jgi:hypothetical protein
LNFYCIKPAIYDREIASKKPARFVSTFNGNSLELEENDGKTQGRVLAFYFSDIFSAKI